MDMSRDVVDTHHTDAGRTWINIDNCRLLCCFMAEYSLGNTKVLGSISKELIKCILLVALVKKRMKNA